MSFVVPVEEDDGILGKGMISSVKNDARKEQREVRMAAEKILSRRLRRDSPWLGHVDGSPCWPEVTELALNGATLIEFDLTGADLSRLVLVGTPLRERCRFL